METKIERVVAKALRDARKSGEPGDAWVKALNAVYTPKQVVSQLKHTCPKWAFCILCHRGYVRDVPEGCCPDAEDSRSAQFTLRAYEFLQSQRTLAAKKSELKKLVFGKKGEKGYRRPNDEVEVLLALLNELPLPATDS